MAYGDSNGIQIPGLIAGRSLTTKQYYFVKMSAATAGAVIIVAATTDVPVGVLQNNPAAGEPAQIQALGATKIVCGTTAVTAGAVIGWNAEGQANVRTNNGSRYAGIGLEVSDADAEIVTIFLQGFSRGA